MAGRDGTGGDTAQQSQQQNILRTTHVTKGHTRGCPRSSDPDGGRGGRKAPAASELWSSGRRWRQLVLSHRPSSRRGWAVFVTKADGVLPPPLPQHRRPVLELRAPCLPLTVSEQGREPHTPFCVGSRWGEPNPSCRNVGAGPRMGCVTQPCPRRPLGHPTPPTGPDPLCADAGPPSPPGHSVLGPEACAGPLPAHAQGSRAEASRGRLGPAGTQSRWECIYIFI